MVFLGVVALVSAPAPLSAQESTSASGTSETGTSEPSEAYVLPAGSLARQRVVALGRDLVIDGEARSHAVALSGDARVSGTVRGDLIVLGGSARLAEGATIGGDVHVLGGHIEMAPGVEIGGRSVAYPDASDLWIALVEGPTLGTPTRVVIGAKLALLAFWSFLVLFLFSIARRELESTSAAVREEPFRNFFVGLTGVSAMVLTALFFSAFSGTFLGVPLLVLVAVVALVLRFWGMVAVFHALGAWLHLRLGRRVPLPLVAATWGLAALGVAKLVPMVGAWTWTLATFLGIGAALTTKFGRREAWIDP